MKFIRHEILVRRACKTYVSEILTKSNLFAVMQLETENIQKLS